MFCVVNYLPSTSTTIHFNCEQGTSIRVKPLPRTSDASRVEEMDRIPKAIRSMWTAPELLRNTSALANYKGKFTSGVMCSRTQAVPLIHRAFIPFLQGARKSGVVFRWDFELFTTV